MSAGASVKGGFRCGLGAVVVLIVAELVGSPVSQTASALALVVVCGGAGPTDAVLPTVVPHLGAEPPAQAAAELRLGERDVRATPTTDLCCTCEQRYAGDTHV